MKEGSFLVVQYWMIQHMDLSGIDLLIYSIVYGFSQDGVSEFKAGQDYLQETLKRSRPTIKKSLDKLECQSYISKRVFTHRGVRYNYYRVVIASVLKSGKPCKETLHSPCKESFKSHVKFLSKPCKETLHIGSKDRSKVKKETLYPFTDFWNDYDKKVGRDKCEKKYEKVSEEDRMKIKDYIPKYVSSQPDKQYRKNPITFLNNKSWNDEILSSSKTTVSNSEFMKRY